MRKIWPNADRERIDHLLRMYGSLNQSTGRKIQSACGHTEKPFAPVQERVFAALYGIHNGEPSHEALNHLFRWMLAHAGTARVDFNPRKTHNQWERIMSRYFSDPGFFTELALAEKLLLTVLRSRKDTPITDILLADRMADTHLATDLIVHQQMPKWRLQLGLQIEMGNHVQSKVNTLLERHRNDRKFFDSKDLPDEIRELLRHDTFVLCLSKFRPPVGKLPAWKEELFAGKRTYQSRHLKEHISDFSAYWRWVMDILEYLHKKIISRELDGHVRANRYLEILEEVGDGVFIRYRICRGNKQGKKPPILTIDFIQHARTPKSKVIISLGIPIDRDFLDLYRDMAGVRAQ